MLGGSHVPVAAFFGAGFDGALWAHAFADAAVVHLNKGDRISAVIQRFDRATAGDPG